MLGHTNFFFVKASNELMIFGTMRTTLSFYGTKLRSNSFSS
jgi:hypothetical protein